MVNEDAWEDSVKYTVQMVSGAMICVPIFTKFDSSSQMLGERDAVAFV
jgi:hypothetical protein